MMTIHYFEFFLVFLLWIGVDLVYYGLIPMKPRVAVIIASSVSSYVAFNILGDLGIFSYLFD